MNRQLGKKWFEIVSQRIDQWTGISPAVFTHLLQTAAVVLLLILFRRIAKKFWVKNIKEAGRRYVVDKFINYVLGFIALLIIARIWISDDVNFVTYFGILSAGLAIALQDLITNLAGWLFIIIRQPFRVGDRVQVGEHAGDIMDVRLFMFSVLEIGKWVDADQRTGRIIHIPNGKFFKDPLFNYTQGFEYIWNEISVIVTFESDWKRAQEIVEEIATANSEPFHDAIAGQLEGLTDKYRVHFAYQPPATWISVTDFGVRITIRHLCHPRKRRDDTDRIWRAVLEGFAKEPSVDFAYPTQRFYDNRMEGKSRAGGPATETVG